MVPKARRLDITKNSKDVNMHAYQDYNRFGDPHLKKYFERKKKIEQNRRGQLNRNDYFVGSNSNYGPQIKHLSPG